MNLGSDHLLLPAVNTFLIQMRKLASPLDSFNSGTVLANAPGYMGG